ncbi:MAG TPA: delta-60 repeat domain-containing protein [Bryobacteraceae bacterium]
MLVEPTGAVLIGAQLDPTGRRQPVQTAVARFRLGGVPDTTFGSGGLSITNATGCTALALLSNGNILVVDGQTVAELTSAGTLESTVTGGVVMASSGSNLNGAPHIFQPNGDYLVAGELFVGEESRGHESSTQVLRFSDTGVADTTFADPSFEFSGPETPDIEAIPNAMAVQSSGAIVVAGQQTKFGTGGSTVNGLARLTSTGNLDTTFGNGGTVTNNVGGSQGILAVAVQPADQKIVTLGIANNGELVIARYLGQ